MNERDYRDIDIHLQKCIDMGYQARIDGKTKYENDFEPGSLSFDAWAKGFNLPDNWKDYVDGIGG